MEGSALQRMCGRSVGVFALVVGLAVTTGTVVVGSPAVATSSEDCSVSAVDDTQAAKRVAVACGKTVEALSERSETTRVLVDASGVGTLESSLVPQRVRRPDGSWVGLTSICKAWMAASRRSPPRPTSPFPGGGTGPLVTWHEAGATFELGWPGTLPVPRIEGDTAIYDEVLPAVNLHVIAGRDGFRHVLEVLTPEAAASPALQQVRYHLGGDMQVTRTTDGGLALADADGTPLLHASPAVMWDSALSADAVQPALAPSAAGLPVAGAAPVASVYRTRTPPN